MDVIMQTSLLLRQEKYPWGVSRRIYIAKPGQKKKKGEIPATRPITIPPFMDRVVQSAILMILESIYEPWFDKMNRSFGFRTSKSTQDAMIAITSQQACNMTVAIEGDISKAFDKADIDTLIRILKKRINDNKFIKLMAIRLRYYVFLTDKNKIERSKEGVQQGGIDSPYLWNIYMYEFDQYIHTYLNNMFSFINNKILKNVSRQHGILHNSLRKSRQTLRNEIKLMYKNATKKNIGKSAPRILKISKENRGKIISQETPKQVKIRDRTRIKEKYRKIRLIRLFSHRLRRLPDQDPNKKELRFFYVRYADDWILLINGSKMLAEKIKLSITNFLRDELKATLSQEKTLITDITNPNTPAHFLGFEITCPQTRKLAIKKVFIPSARYYKNVLSRTSGWQIKIAPDRQRLINRLYMKGYCNKKGFPLSVPWLSTFEPYIIIQKFNAILTGLSNFYTEFIYNKNKINRWIYIIRFSCLKTLAQKYNTTITKIFKRFAKKDENNDGYRKKFGKTVQIQVQLKVKDNFYSKKFHLRTYLELLDQSIKLNRKNKLKEIFYKLENPSSPAAFARNTNDVTAKGRIPKVTDDNFLEKINWVSWRTSANFGMPCSLCGTDRNVQMHHLKHVRKNSYSAIPSERTWEQIMNLRNRRQIPVCGKKTPAIWESSIKEDMKAPNL
jgi:retron-type reverse transcriptase